MAHPSWLMAHGSSLMAHPSSLIPLPHPYPFLLRRGSRGAPPPPPPALRPTLSTPKGLLAKAVPGSGFGAVESPVSFALARAALAFLSLRALAFLSFSRSRLLMTSFRGSGGRLCRHYGCPAGPRRADSRKEPQIHTDGEERHGSTKCKAATVSGGGRGGGSGMRHEGTEARRHRGIKASCRLAPGSARGERNASSVRRISNCLSRFGRSSNAPMAGLEAKRGRVGVVLSRARTHTNQPGTVSSPFPSSGFAS